MNDRIPDQRDPLDDLLAGSAPPLAPRTARFDGALSRVVDAVGPGVRSPGRRRRRMAAMAAAAVGSIGVGVMGATAAGLTPWDSLVPWRTEAGSACTMQFDAAPLDGGPVADLRPGSEQARAVGAADRYLATIDYSAIDTDAALRDFRRAEDAAIAGQVEGEKQPRLKGDDAEITAVGRVVYRRLVEHLAASGFDRPDRLFLFVQGWRCR